jgi:hypothetical protein
MGREDNKYPPPPPHPTAQRIARSPHRFACSPHRVSRSPCSCLHWAAWRRCCWWSLAAPWGRSTRCVEAGSTPSTRIAGPGTQHDTDTNHVYLRTTTMFLPMTVALTVATQVSFSQATTTTVKQHFSAAPYRQGAVGGGGGGRHAVASLHISPQPRVQVGGAHLPGPHVLHHEVVHDGVVVNGLHSEAQTLHGAGALPQTGRGRERGRGGGGVVRERTQRIEYVGWTCQHR